MTIATAPQLRLTDFAPAADAFRREVLAGLLAQRKALPCKFLYDNAGSRLFDQICDLPEYYLTRTEMAILRAHAGEMAQHIGPDCQVVEYGSGSGVKTRLLLGALDAPAAYVPVDISREALRRSAASLSAAFPFVEVLPVCADYTTLFDLPAPSREPACKVAYFPGSTVGNFEPDDARTFLRGVARVVGPGGGLLIGVDLRKDPARLHSAYNDAAGVTAAFNLNLMARINRELDADFALEAFHHYAFYNPGPGRVEMHLVSARSQMATVAGTRVRFEGGESIHTECSYKYTPEGFARLAGLAGFDVRRVWTDGQKLFSVQYLVAR